MTTSAIPHGSEVRFAYYCAKCKNEQTDPAVAERLANKLGLFLWKPKDFAEFGFPVGAYTCLEAIVAAECVICQPPIGRDCSWELGYAIGIGKTVYVIGELDDDDWMTKINITHVDPNILAEPPAQNAGAFAEER
jgi:hypothetical protein